MAMHYDVKVFINGINVTSKTVLPLKYGNFLDERLDECQLSLRGVKRASFSPLSTVEIRLTATEYYGNFKGRHSVVKTDNAVKNYLIADDSAEEVRAGSGVFNHDIYLIEVTKAAECHVVDTLTYTNDLGRTYTSTSDFAEPVWS